MAIQLVQPLANEPLLRFYYDGRLSSLLIPMKF
jgi:hypothetical protein